jgi:hypothetical protein
VWEYSPKYRRTEKYPGKQLTHDNRLPDTQHDLTKQPSHQQQGYELRYEQGIGMTAGSPRGSGRNRPEEDTAAQQAGPHLPRGDAKMQQAGRESGQHVQSEHFPSKQPLEY